MKDCCDKHVDRRPCEHTNEDKRTRVPMELLTKAFGSPRHTRSQTDLETDLNAVALAMEEWLKNNPTETPSQIPLGDMPTPRQEYILTCLEEECAEVIQAITKIKRFGLRVYPRYGNNLHHLMGEISDVMMKIAFFMEAFDLEGKDMEAHGAGDEAMEEKAKRFNRQLIERGFKPIDLDGMSG